MLKTFFLKNEKLTNWKLGNLGNIIPSFLMPIFPILSKSQSWKPSLQGLKYSEKISEGFRGFLVSDSLD